MEMRDFIKKGDVFIVDLGEDRKGSEQKGKRPCVVIQNNKNNRFSKTVIVALISTKEKKDRKGKGYEFHVPLAKGKGGMKEDSVVLLEQIITIDKKARIVRKIGSISLDSELLKKIDEALKYSLFIDKE